MKWALLALAGCRIEQHVQLPAPRPDLAPDDRVAEFMRLKPVDQKTVQVSINGGSWETIGTSITLADKSEVWLPEDLIPVVGDDSETARAARESVAARGKGDIAWYGAIACAVGGLAMIASDRVNPYVSWGTFLGGGLTFMLFQKHYAHVEIDTRKRAFAHYTRDLGDRLNVCAHGTDVVPCDGPLPTLPTAPAQPGLSFEP